VSVASLRRTGLARKLIAGLAAYVLALQLVLPTFALAQLISASLADGVICTHAAAGEQGPGPASDHDPICPCGPACTMASGAALLGPAPVSHAIAWLVATTPYHAPCLTGSTNRSSDIASGPHNPRAPPIA
jgi:hypothetical protein